MTKKAGVYKSDGGTVDLSKPPDAAVPARDRGFVPNSPLPGMLGVVLFILLCVTEAGLALGVCLENLPVDASARTLAIQLYLTIAAIAWYVFAASSTKERLQRTAPLVLLVSAPFLTMVYTGEDAFFWLSLVTTVAWTLRYMGPASLSTLNWQSFLRLPPLMRNGILPDHRSLR